MAIAYVDEYGASVKTSHGLIVIEKDEKELASVRVQELETLVIEENCSITSAAIGVLLRNGVETAFISHGGEFLGKLEPPIGKNIALRKQQYNLSENADFTLAVSKPIVIAKLANMRTILLRYMRGGERTLANDGCEIIKNACDKAENASSRDELMGYEGIGSRAYFNAFPYIIEPPFIFAGRNRNPPQDPVNAMLGFAYALLENSVECAIFSAGLDPYCGFLHQDRYGRNSLVLDLMEEMRPVIADSVVINICNRNMIDANKDFENRDNGLYLNETGRQKFFRIFNGRMEEMIKPFDDEASTTYNKLCALQARKFAACITSGNAAYLPFLIK